MERLQGMVLDFHRAIGHRWAQKPTLGIPEEDVQLRYRLLAEEFDELCEAMFCYDLPGIADGLADLLYVTLGCGLAYGIDLEPVFCEVHKANMAKVGGPVVNGKQKKPEGWQPPRIQAILDMLSERSIQ